MYPTTTIHIQRSAAASVIPRTPVLYICLFLLVLVWPAAIQAAVITPPVTGESTLTVSTTEPQILQPPVIVAHPQSQVAYYGGTLELEVSASGTEPLTYQWFRNGFSIPEGTNRVLQFPNVTFDLAANYNVSVGNSEGTVVSQLAEVTVQFLQGPIKNPENGKIYYLLGRNSWSESEAAAVRLGGHLATVRNQSEQNWIFDTFTILSGVNRNLWIGLYDPDPLVNSPDSSTRRGEFQWSSGEFSSYQNWAAIEPNNDGGGLPEMYVHMWRPNSPSAGRWNDIPDAPITNRPDNPWHGVVELEPFRPVMNCPQNITICPSDSSEPEHTGFPTILSSCSPVSEVILTFEDNVDFDGSITRRWTAFDPVCETSDTCIQFINLHERDDPTISSTYSYGGMIVTFRASGTEGSIVEATWTLNGQELEEENGNGIRFLNNSRSIVEIDFGLYTEVDPDSNFNILVNVRTTCTAQGGAGTGGTAPPIFTLSRTAASIPSSDVRTGNTSVNLQCENVDDDFSAQSRWFRFNVNEAGPASITVTDPSARVAVVTRGATITQLTTRACGLQTVYFPAEPGTTYIVVVESSSSFTLQGAIEDPNPRIELQGNLTFGEVQVGKSVTNTLTISNTGNVPITVSGLTFSVSGFSGNWTGTIPPAVSQAVDIIFAPASPGNYPGNVNVISSVDPGSHALPISGIGIPVPTRIILPTGDLNFAQVQVGSSSNRLLRITNNGNSTLTIQNLIPPVGFTLDWTSASIEPGTFKDLLVTFSPTAALVYDGELKIESNATSGPGVFPVSGTGVPIPTRSISLSGDLAFGDVPIGSASSKPLTISNHGNSPLKVLGIVYPSGFGKNWTGTIAPGGSQTVNVTFTPAAALSYAGNLTVLSDATDGQNTHPVSGKGLSEALISLPPKIEFNNVQLGSSETRAILIRNVGDLPLTITDIAYPQNFTGSPGPMTIAAGGSTNLDVTFTPALALPYSGSVNIHSDGTITLSLVQVTGAGFDLTFSAADLAIPANNSFRLPIQKEPNTEIIIEYSNDLLEWIELGRNDAASGAVEYIDQYPPGTQLRFYRYRYLRTMN